MSYTNILYPIIISFIIIFIMTSVYSIHFGIGFMLATIVLTLLFYYNMSFALFILFVIFCIFIYTKFFPKERQTQQPTKIAKGKKTDEIDYIDNEYDYYQDQPEASPDLEYLETNNDNYFIVENDNNPIVETMANHSDRFYAENSIKSNLPITGDFSSEYREPISVGGDGTMSGYQEV